MSDAVVLAGPVVLAAADDTRAWGRECARRLRSGDVVLLTGELGAGKTTLTQGLGEGLRVRGPITSPTFVIAREHPSLVGGPALVHVDAYRLAGVVELDDLDLVNSLDEAVVVVEWGRGVAEGLSDSYLEVELVRAEGFTVVTVPSDEGDAPDPRTVTLRGHGPRWTDRASEKTEGLV